MDLCFVNDGIAIHHHTDDVAASTISPEMAFLFTTLKFGVSQAERRGITFLEKGAALRLQNAGSPPDGLGPKVVPVISIQTVYMGQTMGQMNRSRPCSATTGDSLSPSTSA